MPHRRRLVLLVGFLVFFVFISSFIYHELEGWSWVDSVYFVSETLTTTGSALKPTKAESKIFTVFFLWGGIAIALYILMELGSMLMHHYVGRVVRGIRREFGAQEMKDERHVDFLVGGKDRTREARLCPHCKKRIDVEVEGG